MNLNKEDHQRIMLNILADISAQSQLSVNLGFKGGTSCYFLYGLDRFSVDLDFDLLDTSKKEQVTAGITDILGKYGALYRGLKQMFWKIKYSEEGSALKFDLSDRVDLNKLNQYEIKDIISGVPLNVLARDDMFAHKLVAISDRFTNKTKNKKIVNRDLYDINFFFNQGWKFNHAIIELRQKMPVKNYIKDLINLINKQVDEKNILDGLGALVDDKKRDWVKNNLKKEVLKQLAISIKIM